MARVLDLVAAQGALRVGQRHVADFAAPAFDQPEGQRIGPCGRRVVGRGERRRRIAGVEQPQDVVGRLERLAAAHHEPCHDVALLFDEGLVGDLYAVDTPRMRRAEVAADARRACGGTYAADACHLAARDDAALLETGEQRRRRLDVVPHLVVTAPHVGDVASYEVDRRVRERMVRAEGADQPLAETVAAPRLRGVDRHGAQRLAGDLSQLVTHVHAERSRVGDVHGHAFEFERDGSFAVERRWCALLSGQFLAQLRVGRGVRHGAVARDALGHERLAQHVVVGRHGPLHAAVLVAQRDFEMEHLFAVADEAEGARLDDAGVDRPDVDLVQRGPFDRVEGLVVDRTTAVVAVEGKAQRFVPRHVGEAHAVAFGDLALEGVHLRVPRRERG